MKKYLVFSGHVESFSKPQGDGWYWIQGEAIIREKMWPYERNHRLNFYEKPYEISGGLIDMGNDIYIPVEWVTAKAKFYGPMVMVPPWQEKIKEEN